jgi:hypothetical protein
LNKGLEEVGGRNWGACKRSFSVAGVVGLMLWLFIQCVVKGGFLCGGGLEGVGLRLFYVFVSICFLSFLGLLRIFCSVNYVSGFFGFDLL